MGTPGTLSPPVETLEQRFRRLESEWMTATMYLSDDRAIVSHPSFRELVSLGLNVVPFMLRDLEKRPHLWVWALPEITGENPVPYEDAGRIDRMAAAWLTWGRAKGYR